MDLQYEVSRKRKDFGVHPNFTDKAVVHFDQESEIKLCNDFVGIPEKTREFHCIPQYSVHAVNTEAFVQEDVGINHVEGGWPENVNQAQDKQRFLRKIEADSNFSRICTRLVDTLKQVTDANLTIDLFKRYFHGDQEDFSTDPPSVDTVYLVRDPSGANRKVCNIAWHHENPSKFAVAYASTDFETNIGAGIPLPSYIWDMKNAVTYEAELLPDSPLLCCAFNPKRSDELIGGCYNGVVAFWDTRAGKRPREQSKIQNSHTDPVYDLAFIQSRSGSEFCSVSTDGQMLWWDARRLSEPIDSFTLVDPDEPEVIHGATCLEYRLDAGGTKYLVGTETGQIFSVERKAKKGEEAQKTIKQIFGKKSKHLGPVRSIQRNFANVKGFLTSGDWGCRMWTEETRTSNFGTGYDEAMVNNACWSPSRFGVFFVGKANGSLDIWDYMVTQDKPTWSQKILDDGISTMITDKSGLRLAVGDNKGTTVVLKLSKSLTTPTLTEKDDIRQMFEREGTREKTLNQAIKTKQAAAGQIAKKEKAEKAARDELEKKNEQIAKKFEDNMTDIEKKYLRLLKKNEPEPIPEKYMKMMNLAPKKKIEEVPSKSEPEVVQKKVEPEKPKIVEPEQPKKEEETMEKEIEADVPKEAEVESAPEKKQEEIQTENIQEVPTKEEPEVAAKEIVEKAETEELTDANGEPIVVKKAEPEELTDAKGEPVTVKKAEPEELTDANEEPKIVEKAEPEELTDAKAEAEPSVVKKAEPEELTDAKAEPSVVKEAESEELTDAKAEPSVVKKAEPEELTDANGEPAIVKKAEPEELTPANGEPIVVEKKNLELNANQDDKIQQEKEVVADKDVEKEEQVVSADTDENKSEKAPGKVTQ